nr:YggT family protein [Frankia sp. EI5c]
MTVYLLLLIARWIIELVRAFNRSFRPTGPLVLFFEIVYTATDPPLRFVRRFIPPLRVGSVALDLGFMLLLIVIFILQGYAQRL